MDYSKENNISIALNKSLAYKIKSALKHQYHFFNFARLLLSLVPLLVSCSLYFWLNNNILLFVTLAYFGLISTAFLVYFCSGLKILVFKTYLCSTRLIINQDKCILQDEQSQFSYHVPWRLIKIEQSNIDENRIILGSAKGVLLLFTRFAGKIQAEQIAQIHSWIKDAQTLSQGKASPPAQPNNLAYWEQFNQYQSAASNKHLFILYTIIYTPLIFCLPLFFPEPSAWSVILCFVLLAVLNACAQLTKKGYTEELSSEDKRGMEKLLELNDCSCSVNKGFVEHQYTNGLRICYPQAEIQSLLMAKGIYIIKTKSGLEIPCMQALPPAMQEGLKIDRFQLIHFQTWYTYLLPWGIVPLVYCIFNFLISK